VAVAETSNVVPTPLGSLTDRTLAGRYERDPTGPNVSKYPLVSGVTGEVVWTPLAWPAAPAGVATRLTAVPARREAKRARDDRRMSGH
jgi:hypothetical protein